MEPLTYSLTALITFSGLFIGKALAHFAAEEMVAGRKYFLLMHKIIFVVIVALLINALNLNPFFRAVIYLVLLAALFFLRMIRSEIIYPLLGLIFFFGSKTELFMAISSLIFIYGFPTGSLLAKKHNILKMFLYHLPFLIVALALFFLGKVL